MSRDQSVEDQIRGLGQLDLASLRQRWKQEFGRSPVSRLSRDLMIRALAWQYQAKTYGGLSKGASRERAAQVAALRSTGSVTESRSAAYKAGTKLIREWQGRVHEVIVMDDGYVWSGSRFRSLSEIARRITGTRWSGPRFFGLEKSGSAARSRMAKHA